ncbi:CFA/I fimbrial chaperone [Paramixta manurensis]|uniref:CFA/I fimbrial chaperone n=1 Tax=Paramixta manurensis TaxID=2740817 RepID=A0A6M8UPL5_9GAMM|nr:CFA/I fimbrial chaperone [Erwiniaceae bacterium PD-1]
MSVRRGVTSINLLRAILCLLALWLPSATQAIAVGNLTFSLAAEDNFAAKRVVNNNKSARLYQVSIVAIDRPGGKEARFRPADGELLFTPRQLTLQGGESEYFKFYYHGPKDTRERYYRVSFREISPRNYVMRHARGTEVSMDPVVVIETILVVRPRQVHFKWAFDRAAGVVSNTGNTWFKLLIKPGCGAAEHEGDAWYLRPGDVVRHAALRKPGNHYIVYNDRFIKISESCHDATAIK